MARRSVELFLISRKKPKSDPRLGGLLAKGSVIMTSVALVTITAADPFTKHPPTGVTDLGRRQLAQ